MEVDIPETSVTLYNVPDGAVQKVQGRERIDAALLGQSGGGTTVLRGSGPPAPGLGDDGNVYVDEDTSQLYGPKSGGAWGTPTTVTVDPATIDHAQIQNVGTTSHDDLDAHVASSGNPHGVTAAQAGAPTVGAFNAHVTDQGNPHNVTVVQAGGDVAGTPRPPTAHGHTGADVSIAYAPINYTGGATAETHFVGIDAAIGLLSAGAVTVGEWSLSTDNSMLNGNLTRVPLDTTKTASPDAALDNEDVLISTAGTYLVFASVTCDEQPGPLINRIEVQGGIYVLPDGGAAYTLESGSLRASYHRNDAAGRCSWTSFTSVNLGVNDRIMIASQRTAGSALAEQTGNGCNIMLVRVA